MRESIYMNDQLAILNFSASYVRTQSELLNCPEFRNFVEIFIVSLKKNKRELYNWVTNGRTVREAKVEIIHAGLECGILLEKKKDLDCISFGPDIYDIHTTKERMPVYSVKRTWEYLLKILTKQLVYSNQKKQKQ